MASPSRHKRRTKLVTPADASFSNCVQDHLFTQPSRGALDNFQTVVYLDEHGRKHGRASDHLLQRQIESDRQKLQKQSKPKVPTSSVLYGIRNPNIVALVKDVPVNNENEDEDEDEHNVPVNEEVKCIEYKKPSNMITSATSRRQTSSTSGKQSVRFDSTPLMNMSRLVDSHLTGLDDANIIDDDDEEDDVLKSTKPVSNPDASSPLKISSPSKDNAVEKSTAPSRETSGTHLPPRVEDINDVEEQQQRKSVDKVSSLDAGQRRKQSSASSSKCEERIKSSSSRPKTALSTRSRTETEEAKSSRASSASTSSVNTSDLLRSDNDESQKLSDEELDQTEEQLPIETPIKPEHMNSPANDAMDIIDQEQTSPVPPVDKMRLRNAKGEYDPNQVIQLRESFQPIITEAASYGHLDVVRQLIESGQSVHTQNILERTPLHEACASGNGQLVTELLDNGALIDQRDARGMTPLHFAASHGSTKCIRILSERGCDINAQDNVGRTAAHHSAMHDHVDALKYLININHIDLTITTNDSKYSIHYAAKNGAKHTLYFFFQSNIMIYATDLHGNTIAHEASEYNQMDCAKLIWKRNGNLFKYKNHLGRTPIHMAALFGSTAVLHWLLELKVIDIDQPDNNGYTMSHLAASRGQGECFACLMMHGAQLDLYTFDRQESVIDIARRSGKGGRIEQARAGVIRCRSCDEKLAKEKYEQAHARNAVEQLIHTQIQRGYNLNIPANRFPINISSPRNRSTT